MNLTRISTAAVFLTLFLTLSCSEEKSNPEVITQAVIDPIADIQTKSVPQVREEVKTLNRENIEKIVNSYKVALESKKNEFNVLKKKIKNISIEDALNGETKKITQEVEEITKTVNSLKERLNIYISKLQELDINISKL